MMCLKNGCFKKHIVYINSTTNIVRNIQDKHITIQNINKKSIYNTCTCNFYTKLTEKSK